MQTLAVQQGLKIEQWGKKKKKILTFAHLSRPGGEGPYKVGRRDPGLEGGIDRSNPKT